MRVVYRDLGVGVGFAIQENLRARTRPDIAARAGDRSAGEPEP